MIGKNSRCSAKLIIGGTEHFCCSPEAWHPHLAHTFYVGDEAISDLDALTKATPKLEDALDALYEISCITNEDVVYDLAIEAFRKLTARKSNA